MVFRDQMVLCPMLCKVNFSNLIITFFTFFEKNIYRCYKFSSYSYQYDKIHTEIHTNDLKYLIQSLELIAQTHAATHHEPLALLSYHHNKSRFRGEDLVCVPISPRISSSSVSPLMIIDDFTDDKSALFDNHCYQSQLPPYSHFVSFSQIMYVSFIYYLRVI